MNKLCCLIGMFITCGVCEGQNLVPNGDFEQYSICPYSHSQIINAVPWMNPSTNTPWTGSPDYFNQCTINPNYSVPANLNQGYQQAHSGVAYCGIYLWQFSLDSVREYIEVPLSSALTADSCYYFEMYVNLFNQCRYTTSTIGVYFSDTAVTGINNYYPLPFVPQITNITGNAFDTLSWTVVSGNYVASGTEGYLIIGNFNSDVNTNPVLVNSTGFNPYIYVHVDDVSLIQVPACNTEINEQSKISSLNLFPNPITDKLNITNNYGELSEIILYDIASRKIVQQKFVNSVSINTEQLAKGIYLYEVRNKSGVIKKGKVVKE